jgi:hypothetical protein
MNMDELKAMMAADSKVDDTVLDQESTKIPQLHNKYLNLLHEERLRYKKLEADHKTLYRRKWEYYTGKLDKEELDELGWEPFQKKILRGDVNIYLDSDSEITISTARMSYSSTKLQLIEDYMKSINNRNWNIRNAIEWRKFLHGS